LTLAGIQCLKNHIDKLVEIRTVDNEWLIAGCHKSQFWNLGKHKLTALNHAARDLRWETANLSLRSNRRDCALLPLARGKVRELDRRAAAAY